MESASGDNSNHTTSEEKNEVSLFSVLDQSIAKTSIDADEKTEETIKVIDANETKLKERIALIQDILASLNQEIIEEKLKLSKVGASQSIEPQPKIPFDNSRVQELNPIEDVFPENSNAASSDCTLNCNEILMEYEEQLQRYQNTLNMILKEKKKSIRKQALVKAFNLKFLEIENQLNIELLNVQYNKRRLDSLKQIIDGWNDGSDYETYDTFDLIPRYPEVCTCSGSDIAATSNPDNSDATDDTDDTDDTDGNDSKSQQ